MSPRPPSQPGLTPDDRIRTLELWRAQHDDTLDALPEKLTLLENKVMELSTTLKVLGAVLTLAIAAVEAFHWNAH